MTEMVHGVTPKLGGEAVLSRWWRTTDLWTMTCVFLLFSIGLLLSFAASPPLAEKNGFAPFHYVERHIIFGSISLLTMISLSMMSVNLVRRLAVIGFIFSFIGLTLLPFFGTDFGKGATRWYTLGFASLQPSEFLKPCFLIFIAWMISASKEINGPPGKLISLILTIVITTLLILQPDFGQACLILFGWSVVYFVAGAHFLLLFGVAAAAIGLGSFAYTYSEHFARRIDGFLSPDLNPKTQLGYATNAIREGGFFGVGVGEGQVKWSLPDAHTDFIIAVAAEEYGFVLVGLILSIYASVVCISLARLLRERDVFVRLAGTGLVCMFGIQAVINIGVAARLLPAKGMTLPFVSYGGSSLIAGGISIGILLALTRSRPQRNIADIFIKG